MRVFSQDKSPQMKGMEMAYFGRDANPLLVTVFLAVWTLVGILYLIDSVKAM